MSTAGLLFALPMTVVGAWYVFHAGSAAKLADSDGQRANAIRVRLRRVNGMLIVLAGFLLYFVISRVQQLTPGEGAGLALPFAVLAMVPLVVLMLLLAWLDMRLTRRMRRIGHLPALLIAVGLLVSGCGEAPAATEPPAATKADEPTPDEPAQVATRPSPQTLPTVEQPLGDTTFTLMVADDAKEREIGLMHRREMGPDEGMVFIFDVDARRNFWMANTLLPLDIIYVDAGGTVLNIVQARPLDRETPLPSVGACRYVVELNRGRSAEAGIEAGTRFDLSPTLAVAVPQ